MASRGDITSISGNYYYIDELIHRFQRRKILFNMYNMFPSYNIANKESKYILICLRNPCDRLAHDL